MLQHVLEMMSCTTRFHSLLCRANAVYLIFAMMTMVAFRACQKNVRFMFFLQLSLTRGLSHDIFDDLVVFNDHWGCVGRVFNVPQSLCTRVGRLGLRFIVLI